MDYNININKICRVCLEEGVLTSIFNMEFAMMPGEEMKLKNLSFYFQQRIYQQKLFL